MTNKIPEIEMLFVLRDFSELKGNKTIADRTEYGIQQIMNDHNGRFDEWEQVK